MSDVSPMSVGFSVKKFAFSPQDSPIYDYNKSMFEHDEDFQSLFMTELKFRDGFEELISEQDEETKAIRENLICKIKKICDEYELSDDTFFRTIFLYDFQSCVKYNGYLHRCKLENKTLKELFIFGEGEADDKKCGQYEKFLDILSCLTISIKYYEHERMSPGLVHILKFFRMEKLNVKIKADMEELKEIDDLQEIIFEIIYEYVCEKQTEICYKINWRLQIVNVKHFIDHYIRILPDFKKLHLTNIKEQFSVSRASIKSSSGILSRKMIKLQEMINEEIQDCIDSVSKLAPLVPDYIHYNSAEIATAAVIISLKHSLKMIQQDTSCEKADLDAMKAMYTRWIQTVYTHYNIDKNKILKFTAFLKDFLAKVCE